MWALYLSHRREDGDVDMFLISPLSWCKLSPQALATKGCGRCKSLCCAYGPTNSRGGCQMNGDGPHRASTSPNIEIADGCCELFGSLLLEASFAQSCECRKLNKPRLART